MFGRKKSVPATANSATDNGSPDSSDATRFGGPGYYDGFAPTDVEKTAGGAPAAPRKMSRIDRPITKSIAGGHDEAFADDASSDPSMSVGKQMELEAGNAIQYRTCSWKKVSIVAHPSCDFFLDAMTDQR